VCHHEFARKHSITDCQSIWVEAHRLDNKQVTKLSDVTVTLHTNSVSSKSVTGRRHMAVVFLYEVEFELEQYIPPHSLGSEYDTAAMTMAYIHPQLLFFLFPETLSPSRRFFIRMKVQIIKNISLQPKLNYPGNITILCYLLFWQYNNPVLSVILAI